MDCISPVGQIQLFLLSNNARQIFFSGFENKKP